MSMEKPTNTELDQYVQKLESLLDYLNIKISIDLYDVPIEVTCSFNGAIQEKYNIWIKRVRISNHDVIDLDVDLYHRMGRSVNLTDQRFLWQDAYDIQNCLYSHLKNKVGNPKEGDVYWKLWDKIK